jgi:hypothetical protein
LGRPFRAWDSRGGGQTAGRCPGLSWAAPSGRRAGTPRPSISP